MLDIDDIIEILDFNEEEDWEVTKELTLANDKFNDILLFDNYDLIITENNRRFLIIK